MDPEYDYSASLIASQDKQGPDNVTFSPYSILSALAMTSAGATGTTLKEMQASLFPHTKDPNAHFASLVSKLEDCRALSVANGIFVAGDLRPHPDFHSLVTKVCRGTIQRAPFQENPAAAVTMINDWVSAQTHGKIPKLVSEDVVQKDTRMILINAIYFKATWKHVFQQEMTQEAHFTPIGGAGVSTIHLMSQTAPFGLLQGKHATIVEMPYKTDWFSMLIILPNDPSQEGWNAIANVEYISSLGKLKSLDVPRSKVRLFLPRFKVEWEADLKEQVESMGVRLAFSNDADFSKMAQSSKAFKISNIIHKAIVEVDEKGTEAAAATAVVMGRGGAMKVEPPVEVCVDRPFMFMIRFHKAPSVSYTPLFVGQVKKL
eukprot:TRINITY_DN17056_c0_g1_i3.p1 TRINITY_DN17056_c0_g1~~TRINITY_DN17056_c0_g1_i3.p1  ORF type:complete len:374 (+),score=76.42 TRINITY_DN17056_c0_g1_i3:250-1371(+)